MWGIRVDDANVGVVLEDGEQLHVGKTKASQEQVERVDRGRIKLAQNVQSRLDKLGKTNPGKLAAPFTNDDIVLLSHLKSRLELGKAQGMPVFFVQTEGAQRRQKHGRLGGRGNSCKDIFQSGEKMSNRISGSR